ncbi:MAG TPA: YihY/virulence factor BrkB family protein [Solirubrobacteraceae bacterium]|nr:YihY/virulence factor BrkB family protein [Solirubrobacteraceae bacterium]
MDLLTPLKRFDAYQQRHEALSIAVAVVKKFGDDGAGSLAALVAYYAFFSLFPLLLVFVTVLGFALHGHPGTISSVEHSVARNFPGFAGGSHPLINFHSLTGSVVALIIGLLTSLWSGLGITGAAQNALDTVWAVPKKHRPNFLAGKGRGLLLILSLGLLFLVATLVSGIVTGGFGGVLAKILGILISLGVNVLLFLVAFRFMTASSVATRDLRTGIAVAAVLWTALQVAGGIYVKHVLAGLSGTYSTFAVVIALFVWLHLGAQLTLYAAELNVVLRRRLYPRSLLGPPEQPADQATLAALAKIEERSQEEHVEVAFSDPQPESGRSSS